MLLTSLGYLWDGELSLKAKGLLTMMIHSTEDGSVELRSLEGYYPEGAFAFTHAVNELVNRKYITKLPLQREGGLFTPVRYVVSDTPMEDV
jgi:hypothetical protein